MKIVIKSYVIEVEESIEQRQVIESTTNSYKFELNREIYGYPESVDFQSWKIRVHAINIYGKESLEKTETIVNIDNYGTWKLQAPVVSTRISDRTITLIINQPNRADSREVYGNLRNRIEIKKPSIDNNFFKPATNLNPRPVIVDGVIVFGNEENYKVGEGYILVNDIHVQEMTLTGQSTNDMVNTL